MKETRPEVPGDARPRLQPAAVLRLLLPVLLVIVVAPILALTVFWIVHVWPERVALARDHPQKDAIQALCLLSLVFGGLLWPLAMLWAYMKPLRFRLEPAAAGEPGAQPAVPVPAPCPHPDAHFVAQAPVDEEVVFLRHRIAALQGRLDVLERDSSTLHG